MSTLRACVRLFLITAFTLGLVAFWWVVRLFLGVRTQRGLAWRRVLMHVWSRGALWIIGIRLELVGPLPPTPCVLVSNHMGYVDIPVLSCCTNALFVSKVEVRSWPIIGWIAAAVGTIFVDRAARRAIPEVNAKIHSALEQGDRVLFFPEGTSTDGERILPFKSSLLEPAVQSGYPVFCAAVRYSTVPGDPPASQAVCWWGNTPFEGHVFGLLRLSHFRAQVVFHPEPLLGGGRKELAERTERLVGEMHRALIGA